MTQIRKIDNLLYFNSIIKNKHIVLNKTSTKENNEIFTILVLIIKWKDDENEWTWEYSYL